MPNRFPLIANSSVNQIQELAAGDNLDLTSSGISNVGNIFSVGIITAVSASFSGNVSIAGTLTYEDVTNVDSVGLVTARSGVNVTGGSINISSGGLTVSGVTTVAAGSTSAPSVSPTGDNNTGIFFPAADTIAFAEGGVEVGRFDSSANLLLGTTTNLTSGTTQKVVFKTGGGSARGLYLIHNLSGAEEYCPVGAQFDTNNQGCKAEIRFGNQNTSGSPSFISFATESGSGFVERCRISSTGGFSLGTTANPGAGAIFATGDITAFYSSDIRLKKDIEPISEPIKKLMEITGVTYKWNEEYLKDKDVDGYFVRETEVGVIAQEVEKVLPEVVATRENGYKAVRYEKLVALLIEAVKDQQKQIDELKARLEEV